MGALGRKGVGGVGGDLVRLARGRGALGLEVVAGVVLRQVVGVALEGLEGLGPVPLPRLLALLGIVVGPDGGPVGERHEEREGALLVDGELAGDLDDGDAAAAMHEVEAVGEAVVVLALHAADAVVAAQQDGRDAELGAVGARLAEEALAAGHAEVELGHADAERAGRQEVTALVDDDEKRQDDEAPEYRGNDGHGATC